MPIRTARYAPSMIAMLLISFAVIQLGAERLNQQSAEISEVQMRQGIREVLESREVGTQSSWRNPETGVSGVAELTRVYEDNGTPCGSVSFQVQGRNRAAPYNMNFCQMPDGGWGIAP